jgi:hypothetical protein
MGRMLRSLLLLATLSLWLTSAGAFCVSEVAYNYVMRGDEPAPGQSLPCCSAAARVTAAVQKAASLDGNGVAAAGGEATAFAPPRAGFVAVADSPLRWRSYCRRSARLLE